MQDSKAIAQKMDDRIMGAFRLPPDVWACISYWEDAGFDICARVGANARSILTVDARAVRLFGAPPVPMGLLTETCRRALFGASGQPVPIRLERLFAETAERYQVMPRAMLDLLNIGTPRIVSDVYVMLGALRRQCDSFLRFRRVLALMRKTPWFAVHRDMEDKVAHACEKFSIETLSVSSRVQQDGIVRLQYEGSTKIVTVRDAVIIMLCLMTVHGMPIEQIAPHACNARPGV